MNSLFFWIIVLSFLVPTALRLYKKSVRGRNQGMPGGFPNQPDGRFPGQFPGELPGRFPGKPNNQPRDGYTQQDYFGGGFRQPGGPGQPGYQNPVPYEDSPEYLNNPSQSGQQPSGQQPTGQQPEWQQPAGEPSGPSVPTPPSAPQGFRARKLAELDQRYSNGELAMEDYMAQRAEIMKG
ncbi:hypothetical protein [Pseudarthrobacter sp. S9]|uniref:hypothetical protein n=1 Tax=Pseudarthrobacter sp. S9 TaxID=3418421 RepID=UPI003D07E98C